ncbi:MAG: hypothetical protein ACOZEN_14665 [Thermodesulfobacteriota bacterium]
MVLQGLAAGEASGPDPVEAFHNASAWEYRRDLEERTPDVVYFADSVMGGHCESEARTTLAELFAAGSGRTVRGVSGAGYTAVVFRGYALVTSKAEKRPSLAILALNPRSLSDGWFFSEDYQYSRLASYLAALACRPSWGDWLAWLPRRMGAEELDSRITRDARAGTGPDAGEYFRSMRRDLKAFGPPGPSLDEEERGIREHFLVNYMSTRVDRGHPMLAELLSAVRLLRAAGVRVVVYVTPVNVREAERLIGPRFVEEFRRDMADAAEVFGREGVAFADLSELLDGSRFVDKQYACEHLDLEGRRILAARVAEAAARDAPPGR